MVIITTTTLVGYFISHSLHYYDEYHIAGNFLAVIKFGSWVPNDIVKYNLVF